MPVTKEAYLRYRIIDECIRGKFNHYPSMEDVIEACEEKLGKTFSVSAIQKDIQAMKEDSVLGFYAPIKYSRVHFGYYYADSSYSISNIPLTDKDLASLDFAASILQQFKGTGLIDQFDDAVDKIAHSLNINSVVNSEKEINNIIQFDRTTQFKGSEYVSILIEAIQKRKKVEITYQRFVSEQPRKHLLQPYWLREYNHLWYLVAFVEKHKTLVTYALDRVKQVEITNEKYAIDSSINPAEYFKHTYGIYNYQGKPEKVRLRFAPILGNYLKTQPLHQTQEIIKDTKTEFTIQIHVGITLELINDILKYGSQVKVLAPKTLISEIQKTLKNTLNQYIK